MEISRLILAAAISLLLAACGSNQNEPRSAPVYQSQEFHEYWHAGKAEINSYRLDQSRYGESRKGNAVLIFVTEDFSRNHQVKLDDPTSNKKVNVLKLNFTKNFITGIYPYSLMLSVFTPTNRQAASSSLKATMSSQEWCGQVYTQLNLRGTRYVVKSHSYFEQEADEHWSTRHALLEDELWNYIRLDHGNLPQGEIEVIPGLFYSRLSHVNLKIQNAIGRKTETDSSFVYTLDYPKQERSIAIQYLKVFPHKILGWEEVWKERGKTMRTTATLDKTLYTDYWTKNKNEFSHLRDSLNLPHY